jgi:hypothetical protein
MYNSIKPKAKYIFYMAVMLLFSIVQRKCCNKLHIVWKPIYHHTKLQDPILRDDGVTSTSEIHTAIMVMMVINQKVQRYDFHTDFPKILVGHIGMMIPLTYFSLLTKERRLKLSLLIKLWNSWNACYYLVQKLITSCLLQETLLMNILLVDLRL